MVSMLKNLKKKQFKIKLGNKLPLKFKVDKKLKRFLIFLAVLGVVCYGLFRIKHLFVAAVVNNRPITRLALIREIESQAGKQILEGLVSQELVRQEAKRLKLTISPGEVQDKLLEIEQEFTAQGADFEELLSLQGETKEGLKKDIELQLLIEKMLEDKLVVTDKEVSAYFEENIEFFPEETELEDVKETIKDQLKQQRMAEVVPNWLEELKAKSDVRYFLDL